MKFIRVNGRVIPVKGEGSAPKGSGVSKRYGAKKERAKSAKQIGIAKGASFGAVAGAALKKFGTGSIKAAAIGAAAGAVIGSVKFYKKKRGESDKQLAKRAGKYK